MRGVIEENHHHYETEESSSCLGVNVKVFSFRGIEVDGYTLEEDHDEVVDEHVTTRQKEDEEEEENDTDGDIEAPLPSLPSPSIAAAAAPVVQPPTPRRQQQQFSKQRLCCPITRQPFVNPVVCRKDGVTYERDALIAREGNRDPYHPNRALLEYMDPNLNPMEELSLHTISATAPTSTGSSSRKGIFVCVITGDLMRDPVIDMDGYNYERTAIVDWIENHGGISPITRKPLRIDQLYDNTTLFRVLYREILYYNNKSVVQNSEEVQQWKRDVSNFNYLTNQIKPTINNGVSSRSLLQHQQPQSSSFLPEEPKTAAAAAETAASSCRHPADMRVDYNGRWRHQNKNTVTMIGLLVIISLCVVVFLLFEFVVG